MKVVDRPITAITVPAWNPNQMDEPMRQHLRNSIKDRGLVIPIVVRRSGKGRYECIAGAQRLRVLEGLGVKTVPCVVVTANEAKAKLLSQALNHIHGEDDIGLRADLLRSIVETLPQAEVLAVLPETLESLRALTSLGQEDLATHLRAWQQAQGARLCHLQVQLTRAQMDVVAKALERALPKAKRATDENPNIRGRAIYMICRAYLRKGGV